jgi:5-methylcytosine-specific restriction endonuclease McrA
MIANSPGELYVRLLSWRQENIRKRAGYKCENCYQHKPIQVHHKLHRSKGGNHAYLNLVALCQECHGNTHAASGLHKKLKDRALSASAQERLDHDH